MHVDNEILGNFEQNLRGKGIGREQVQAREICFKSCIIFVVRHDSALEGREIGILRDAGFKKGRVTEKV